MILVTGAKGQLGSDVSAELKKRNIPHIPTDVDTLDITDKAAAEKFFYENGISAVIHCAAYTAVDKAESESELCFKINLNHFLDPVYENEFRSLRIALNHSSGLGCY